MPKMKKYSSATDYYEDQSELAQQYLSEVRTLILTLVPDAKETITYSIPAFALVKNGKASEHFMMAAYKNHLSIYPNPSTIQDFKDKLQDYEVRKGTIQFPYKKPLPLKLIQEIILYRRQKLLEKL